MHARDRLLVLPKQMEQVGDSGVVPPLPVPVVRGAGIGGPLGALQRWREVLLWYAL